MPCVRKHKTAEAAEGLKFSASNLPFSVLTMILVCVSIFFLSYLNCKYALMFFKIRKSIKHEKCQTLIRLLYSSTYEHAFSAIYSIHMY